MLQGYASFSFTDGPWTRTVHRQGKGPGVIIMHEVPGIHPTVLRFAKWVVDAGFTVFLPDLLGDAGRPVTPGYTIKSLATACIRKEFHVLASHHASPITNWLRALCRHAHAELGGKGVGAVGMCLTGNFALSLMMEPCMMAPVLSQPSLPFPLTSKHKAALHISPEELANLKKRVTEEGCKVLGLRFTGDPLSPPQRFATLRKELGEGFEGIEIDSKSCPNSKAPLGAHSVLTEDLVDEAGHPTALARDRVLAFFQERLLAG